LIRLAAGLLQPEAGNIQRSPLAMADDAAALDRERPLERALAFWVRSPQQAMEALGLAPLAQVPVRLLSSGQLKRASLARVAASGAPVWLLDEPFNALDTTGSEMLDKLIAKHRTGGGAVLAASHHPLTGVWRTLELRA
jgi:heme exporter protein A